jgi:hypothetical protein
MTARMEELTVSVAELEALSTEQLEYTPTLERMLQRSQREHRALQKAVNARQQEFKQIERRHIEAQTLHQTARHANYQQQNVKKLSAELYSGEAATRARMKSERRHLLRNEKEKLERETGQLEEEEKAAETKATLGQACVGIREGVRTARSVKAAERLAHLERNFELVQQVTTEPPPHAPCCRRSLTRPARPPRCGNDSARTHLCQVMGFTGVDQGVERCLAQVLLLCCAVLCCAVLCCAVLCCAMLCCAMLCYAVLCCAMRLAQRRAHEEISELREGATARVEQLTLDKVRAREPWS